MKLVEFLFFASNRRGDQRDEINPKLGWHDKAITEFNHLQSLVNWHVTREYSGTPKNLDYLLKNHYNIRMANMFLDKENCSEALGFCINAKAIGHMHAQSW